MSDPGINDKTVNPDVNHGKEISEQGLSTSDKYDVASAVEGADSYDIGQAVGAAAADSLRATGKLVGDDTGEQIADTVVDGLDIAAANAAGMSSPAADKYDVAGAVEGADSYDIGQAIGAAAADSLRATGNLVGDDTGEQIANTVVDGLDIAAAKAAGVSSPAADKYDVAGAVEGADSYDIGQAIGAAAADSLRATGNLVGDDTGEQIANTVVDGLDIAAAKAAGVSSPAADKYDVAGAIEGADNYDIGQAIGAAAADSLRAIGKLVGDDTGEKIANTIVEGLDTAAQKTADMVGSISSGIKTLTNTVTDGLNAAADKAADIVDKLGSSLPGAENDSSYAPQPIDEFPPDAALPQSIDLNVSGGDPAPVYSEDGGADAEPISVSKPDTVSKPALAPDEQILNENTPEGEAGQSPQFTSPFARDPIYNETLDHWGDELLEQQGFTQNLDDKAATSGDELTLDDYARDLLQPLENNAPPEDVYDTPIVTPQDIDPMPSLDPDTAFESYLEERFGDTDPILASVPSISPSPDDAFADPSLSEPFDYLASATVDIGDAGAAGEAPMDLFPIDYDNGGDHGGGPPSDGGGL